MKVPKFKINDLVKVFDRKGSYVVLNYTETPGYIISDCFWYKVQNTADERDKLLTNEACLTKIIDYNRFWTKLNE